MTFGLRDTLWTDVDNVAQTYWPLLPSRAVTSTATHTPKPQTTQDAFENLYVAFVPKHTHLQAVRTLLHSGETRI